MASVSPYHPHHRLLACDAVVSFPIVDSRIPLASYVYSVLLVLMSCLLVSCGESSGVSGTITTPTPTANEFVYVTDSVSGAISGLQVNTANGVLGTLQPFVGNASSAPRAVTTALGKYLYVANQNANTVSAYAISASTGALTAIASYATGVGPRSLVADATGKFLYVANFADASISAFSINATTGVLTPISGSPFGAGGTFYAIATDLAGKFVYVTDNGFLRVYGFAINSTTGALTPVPGGFLRQAAIRSAWLFTLPGNSSM